ncbi:MAG: hypothetical protein KDB00_07000 [Planctomycetales bacterium]|nr:hypothetical protein [Planctomycetales bacterium]
MLNARISCVAVLVGLLCSGTAYAQGMQDAGSLSIRFQAGTIQCAAVTLSGNAIAAGGSDAEAFVLGTNETSNAVRLDRGSFWGKLDRDTNLTHRILAFSPDGKRIVSGHSLVLGRQRQSRLPNGRWAVLPYDFSATIWDAVTGAEMIQLGGNRETVSIVGFSPDSNRVITGYENGSAILWDAATGVEALSIKGHSNVITCVAFSQDGRQVATGSEDKTVKVWDTLSGKEVHSLDNDVFVKLGDFPRDRNGALLVPSGAIASLAFSPDGQQIVAGNVHGHAHVWDLVDQKISFQLSASADSVHTLTYRSDGQHILSASREVARIWDAETGRELSAFAPNQGAILSAAFRGEDPWLLMAKGREVTFRKASQALDRVASTQLLTARELLATDPTSSLGEHREPSTKTPFEMAIGNSTRAELKGSDQNGNIERLNDPSAIELADATNGFSGSEVPWVGFVLITVFVILLMLGFRAVIYPRSPPYSVVQTPANLRVANLHQKYVRIQRIGGLKWVLLIGCFFGPAGMGLVVPALGIHREPAVLPLLLLNVISLAMIPVIVWHYFLGPGRILKKLWKDWLQAGVDTMRSLNLEVETADELLVQIPNWPDQLIFRQQNPLQQPDIIQIDLSPSGYNARQARDAFLPLVLDQLRSLELATLGVHRSNETLVFLRRHATLEGVEAQIYFDVVADGKLLQITWRNNPDDCWTFSDRGRMTHHWRDQAFDLAFRHAMDQAAREIGLA